MADNEQKNEFDQYLTFTLGKERFALNIGYIREILDDKDFTKVPGMLECMRGVINVRGHAVPVVDLRLKLGMPQKEMTVDSCVIITEYVQDEDVDYLGALADSVQEVLELTPENITPPPTIGVAVESQYILGMGKCEDGFLIILNPKTVLVSETPNNDISESVEEAGVISLNA